MCVTVPSHVCDHTIRGDNNKGMCVGVLGGVYTGSGTRNDLKKCAEMILAGTPIEEVMETQPVAYMRNCNGMARLATYVMEKNTPKWRNVHVTLHAGPTGIGKSKGAAEAAENVFFIQGYQLKWWNGYRGELCACFDDYNNNVKIDELLHLLDGRKIRLEIKNGHTYAQWTKVIITTNLRIREIHPNAKKAHRDALFRRINKVVDDWPEETDDFFVYTD